MWLTSHKCYSSLRRQVFQSAIPALPVTSVYGVWKCKTFSVCSIIPVLNNAIFKQVGHAYSPGIFSFLAFPWWSILKVCLQPVIEVCVHDVCVCVCVCACAISTRVLPKFAPQKRQLAMPSREPLGHGIFVRGNTGILTPPPSIHLTQSSILKNPMIIPPHTAVSEWSWLN